jgi:ubiquitin-protein ligase
MSSTLALRRITIDTKRVMELPVDAGLYWIPDESDITHGWAIICGSADTPYYGGSYAFDVKFSDNYPFEPPKFTFLTQDGRTRFNPNLYKNGKVCLSLLNTWQGEPWSGVQSLCSVLQCIQTAVMTADPLRNEPAYPVALLERDIEIYNRMILHASIETAILEHLAHPPVYMAPVHDALQVLAHAARPTLIKICRELAVTWDGRTESLDFYKMSQRYRFGDLAAALERI